MEDSILISTKQILGLGSEDDAFDLDILTHINTTLSVLHQMGVLESAVIISDSDANWTDLELADEVLTMTRTYVFLKVQYLWDTPNTSFLINAREAQISELEYRLNMYAEGAV
jgi:hypothetical protein